MRTGPPDAVGRLLMTRLAETGDPERSPTLGEVVSDLLPYAAVRASLGLTTKAEYDLALLGWLASGAHVRIDPALAEAVERELGAPEPGLELVDRFAGARVEPVPGGAAAGAVPPELPAGTRSRNGLAEAEEIPSIPATHSKTDPPRTPVGLDPGFFPTPPPRGGPARGLVFRFASDEPARPPTGPAESGNGSKASDDADPAATPQAATAVARPDLSTEREPSVGRLAPQRLADATPAAGVARARCRDCSRPLPTRAAARYCPHCGADQTAGRCVSCGDRLEAEWAFCPRCGRPAERPRG